MRARRGNGMVRGLALWSAIIGLAAAGSGCGVSAGPSPRRVEYHGIRPSDPGGRVGLRNPERGFRIEAKIAQPAGARDWDPPAHLGGQIDAGYSEQWWIMDALRYEQHGLTLAQAYCYLTEFADGPIPPDKLARLQRSLDNLRVNGLKALLRFAYERDGDRRGGPTLQRILDHIDELTPIIRQNADVNFILQAGFVGAWGEWHSSTHDIEKDQRKLAAIVAKLLRALPADRMTQVRVPKYKAWVLSDPYLNGYLEIDGTTAHSGIPAARIGFHNDGFLARETDGGTWPEKPFLANPGNPWFDYMTRESAYLPVDGELFWSDPDVDGIEAAVRLRLHHYSSLSLAHSYSERQGKPFSMDNWRRPITIDQVRENKLPLSDGYFEDETGGEAPRQQFEYIRDHLGYRIELQSASFPAAVRAGGTLPVTIELINRGFSTLHNPRPAFVTLIDEAGAVTEFPIVDQRADPQRWQPFEPGDENFAPIVHEFGDRVMLPDSIKPGRYKLGLWLPDPYDRIRLNPDYAVRVANRDAPWWTDSRGRYGINILGEVEVRP